jgi:ABC-type Fe3+-siderophore transport system permease subunit
MIFSLGKYDESSNAQHSFTCKNFIALMRGEPNSLFSSAFHGWFDDPDTDSSNVHKKILKTTRCYTSDQFGKSVPVTHRMLKIASRTTSDDDGGGKKGKGRRASIKKSNLMEEYERNVLRQEYIDIVGVGDDGEPKETDEQTFNCLVCQTIVHRLQVACGLQTELHESFDQTKIICKIQADSFDLMTEADRIDYRLQAENCPFEGVFSDAKKTESKDKDKKKKKAAEKKDEREHPPCGRFASKVLARERPLEINKSIEHLRTVQQGNVGRSMFHPKRHFLGKKPRAANEKEPELDPELYTLEQQEDLRLQIEHWQRQEHGKPHSPAGLVVAPFVPYKMEWKYQPLYRHYGPRVEQREQYEEGVSLFRQVDRVRLVNSLISRHINTHQLLQRGYLDGFFALHTHDTMRYDDVGPKDKHHSHLPFHLPHGHHGRRSDADSVFKEESGELEWLRERWAWSWSLFGLCAHQPIMAIRGYFGEKVAFYFDCLEYYTQCLRFPAIAGAVVQAINFPLQSPVNAAQHHQNYTLFIFLVFVAAWCSYFLEGLKQRTARLSLWWGTLELETEERIRPEFHGKKRNNPVFNFEEDHYSSDVTHRVRIGLSTMLTILMCLVSVCSTSLCFVVKQKLQEPEILGEDSGAHVAGLIMTAQIIILNKLFSTVGKKLTQWENHRTNTEFDNALVMKTFWFQFVNSYLSFFYIAFIKNYWESKNGESGCLHNSCMYELQVALQVIFVTHMLWGNFTELGVPYMMMYVTKTLKARRDQKHSLAPSLDGRKTHAVDIRYSQAERESMLHTYGVDQAFEDHAEMVIQFGFTTMFVTAFPLTFTLALFANVIELHVDARKLCDTCKRPFPHQAKDMGSWFFFFRVISLFAVVTNTAIICFVADIPLIANMSLSNR